MLRNFIKYIYAGSFSSSIIDSSTTTSRSIDLSFRGTVYINGSKEKHRRENIGCASLLRGKIVRVPGKAARDRNKSDEVAYAT